MRVRDLKWREKRKAQEQQIQEYTEQLENDRDSLTRLQQIEKQLRRIENELALNFVYFSIVHIPLGS
jgi:hypothetical protein